MRILRSFPLPGKIPPGRAYVADDYEKLHTPVHANGSADFSALRLIDDDAVFIEWDVAVDRAELARFCTMAEGRDWPIVGPHYKLDGDEIRWCMFRETPGGFRAVYRGEPDCDRFPACGLLYLPGGLLRDCPLSDPWSPVMNEGVIGRYLRTLPEWRPYPIAWDITIVHLH